MEKLNDIKKIARKFIKNPKVYQIRKKIQIVASSGAFMELYHEDSGKNYEIFDPNDNLVAGGDYDSVLEPFAEFKDILRSLKLENINQIKPSRVSEQRVFYEGILSTLFGRVVAGAKPSQVVKQATKNHPKLKGMEKQIRKDLEDLDKDRRKLAKMLGDLD